MGCKYEKVLVKSEKSTKRNFYVIRGLLRTLSDICDGVFTDMFKYL